MKNFFVVLFMLPGFCFAEEIREIPSFYLKPEFHSMFAEYPLVVDNGYVVLDSVQRAGQFIDPLPPDVNFDSETAIVFAWNGSDADKIDYEKIDNIYHFVYKHGLTNNIQHHVKIMVIPKKYDWLYHRVIK